MDVQATQPPSSSSTAAYPPWVILEPGADVETTGSCSTADPKTLMVARTSAGHPIGVSLGLKSPPAESLVCIHFPLYSRPDRHSNEVIAAHGDSLLIRVVREEYYDALPDYFVYNAGTTGAGSPQPPSLSLLPPCCRHLTKDSTGLLHRGEDELVVAQLQMVPLNLDETPAKYGPEVFLFRSGKWLTVLPRISCFGNNNIEEDKFMSWFRSRSVIPVGNDLLCWVDMSYGLIFSNLYDESPGLRHVSLAADPCCTESFSLSRNVCVTAGDVVKFVNIFALAAVAAARVETDAKIQIMPTSGVWALDSYKSLPRVQEGFPVVSMDEPHIICFMVCDEKAWLIMVDMRSKMLRSVYCYSKRENGYPGKFLLPSKVSYYLNSYSGSSRQTDIQSEPFDIPNMQLTYHASNSELLPSGCNTCAEPGAHASEILAALEEISSYGLDGDDMRKAISILSHGNGRRFRSYLGIPKILRKDWLLTEINASIS
ncbi:hypothetical protein EJB05_53526, partial [Eragrostis curvula]